MTTVLPQDKMSLYAQGYDQQNQPRRLTPDVLADEAYGVRTSARDLIHFAQLNHIELSLKYCFRKFLINLL